MRALSIRAPWWWFILHAGKDIENRDWHTNLRGRVLIHASRWYANAEVQEDFNEARRIYEASGLDLKPPIVSHRSLQEWGGCIVGSVEVAGCVKQSKSPWFFGEFGFVLRNPVAFARPWPVKGALGFFEVAQIPPGTEIAEARG
jgi:hypothetical protein